MFFVARLQAEAVETIALLCETKQPGCSEGTYLLSLLQPHKASLCHAEARHSAGQQAGIALCMALGSC